MVRPLFVSTVTIIRAIPSAVPEKKVGCYSVVLEDVAHTSYEEAIVVELLNSYNSVVVGVSG